MARGGADRSGTLVSHGFLMTVYQLCERVVGRPEDGRYAEQRRRHGDSANAWFFETEMGGINRELKRLKPQAARLRTTIRKG